MKPPRACYAFGALAFAFAASTMSASPVAAAAAVGDEPQTTYYLCADGKMSTKPCAEAAKTKSVVEQPAAKPAPTVQAATPPFNIVCRLPMVPTLRGDKWQCIVPAKTKLDL